MSTLALINLYTEKHMITIKLNQHEIVQIISDLLKQGYLSNHVLQDSKVIAGRNGNGVSLELSFTKDEEYIQEDTTVEEETNTSEGEPVKRTRRKSVKEDKEEAITDNSDLDIVNNYKPVGLFTENKTFAVDNVLDDLVENTNEEQTISDLLDEALDTSIKTHNNNSDDLEDLLDL